MDLFGESPRVEERPAPKDKGKVRPAAASSEAQACAAHLPASVHLGTSSWSFPGWKDLVWDGDYSESVLSRHGLASYAHHPLLHAVSLDRAFYQPLTASQYAAYAAQVPDHFRFVVKAPALVADALVRAEDGRGVQANPAFLSPELAVEQFVAPALEGLGPKAGALVFQLSPLPGNLLDRVQDVMARLEAMLAAAHSALTASPGTLLAVEVRNREFLTPEFARLLKRAGAVYCLGLHAKMPPIEEQLPLLRALWPAPLVCRWNLHRRHGAFGYEDAKKTYEPFNRLVDPDPATRAVLAKVAAATAAAGLPAIITINNKAEGSAPLSVLELGRAIAARLQEIKAQA
jgi:uncharacterized protein YecE (DUF72 family)